MKNNWNKLEVDRAQVKLIAYKLYFYLKFHIPTFQSPWLKQMPLLASFNGKVFCTNNDDNTPRFLG